MTHATYYTGDVLDVLATLEPGSVDLVLTSPPFLALRSYLPSDHPDKAKEGGQEKTPGEFIDWLLNVVEACDRVLAPHGSMAFELGDTFAGSGTGDEGGSNSYGAHVRGDRSRGGDVRHIRRDVSSGWPADKSLTLVPETFRFALAYGFNPHTGRTTTPWRIRNVVRWVRPNPPVGALGDKFRPATSEMVVFCRTDEAGRRRYFDLDAVREPHVDGRTSSGGGSAIKSGVPRGAKGDIQSNPAGAPPLDWWEIPTHPYKGAHYATWPPALCVKPIKAMSPEKVCVVCGEASRRVVDDVTLDSYRTSTRPQTIKAVRLADEAGLTPEHIAAVRAVGINDAGKALKVNSGAGKNTEAIRALAAEAKAVLGGYFREFASTNEASRASTWTDCGHDTWRPGTVLDPFAGSGTTLAVAIGHGRNAIGIDLDERNVEFARERIGPMFFTWANEPGGAA